MKISFLDLLAKLRDPSIGIEKLNEAVLLTVSIAYRLINKNQKEFGINIPYVSSRELAEDAITPLFLIDTDGQLPIRKSLLNWNKEINDEASARYFLFNIVQNRIVQESAKKLKESDPFFAKILRSINNLVERGKYKKLNWFGITYLVMPHIDQFNEKPVDPEFTEKLPSPLFQGSAESIVNKLMDYLKNEGHFQAVPQNALVRKIKHVNALFFSQSDSNTTNMHLEAKLDIQKIALYSMDAVNQRIEDFYLKKERITPEVGEIFKKIINRFTIDLQDGGISRGLYEYMYEYLPHLSKEEYYSKYQQPLDYLLRLLKKEIALRLEALND